MSKVTISEIPVVATVPLDGTELWEIEQGGVSKQVAGSHFGSRILNASAALNFADTAAGTSTDLTIAVVGAALGDLVILGVPHVATVANGCFTAWVSAADVVTVRFLNNSLLTALNPAEGTFKVRVCK